MFEERKFGRRDKIYKDTVKVRGKMLKILNMNWGGRERERDMERE